MTDTVWIVYRDGEPTTAHASEDAAKQAAVIAFSHASGRYIIRTAALAPLRLVGADPGIPVYRLRDGTEDVLGEGKS